ncbi:MAG: DUF47 family protein [Thaumarchaeota archaeon]|nr:DUF47 family protein [Nitrososphaerota archaeon]
MRRISKLFVSGEQEVTNSIRRHFTIVEKCVELLYSMIEKISEGDQSFVNLFSDIDLLETQADEIHKSASEKIASGSFFAYLSSDFLNLLERNDDIADATKDAAKVLVESNLSNEILTFVFKNLEGKEYVASLLKTVKTLGKLYEVLESAKKEEIIKFSHNVERYEEDADLIKARVMKELFLNSKKFNVLDVVVMKDFLNVADNIADNAEDASDIVLKIIAKGFS